MKPFLLLPLFLLLSFSRPADPVIVDKAFSIEMPEGNEVSNLLLDVVKKSNTGAIHAGIVVVGGKRTPFLVTRYTYDKPVTAKDALAIAAGHKASDESYTMKEARPYSVNGHTLYRKISVLHFEGGQDVSSDMYYVVRDGKARDAYELKVSCDPASESAAIALLEKVTLSLHFL
ncbi:hypothetical protein EPD60_11635 [Flaviaesturariibacter flavus]|uniref:DUF1795 domain-containing protein n=1 Tax=Flaviaesturariibacter flavus TaxID=2502780 RepID=A0A4V2NVJ8_9BACT|nr:hypothetical protein [Flaviaesturariibacter flavus]TCJ13742.1 hypothetical protein EPD60_11635 [Flaviaesturariibacter flavus]